MSIAGWLPEDWAKAVLPLAVRHRNSFQPVGTAFLVAHQFNSQTLNCLVTAKHVVFDGNGQQRDGMYILASRVGGGGHFTEFRKLTERGLSWKALGDLDIAATLLPISPTFDVRKFARTLFGDFSSLREGDDVFFMGFPLHMGVSATAGITPIVRAGIIAKRNDDQSFLIDANVFPGNSGSPVFFRPCPFEITSGRFRRRFRPPKLIGVLSSVINYSDEAVSRQTGRTRVIFEENSGLATALSIELLGNVTDSSDFQNMVSTAMESNRISAQHSGTSES